MSDRLDSFEEKVQEILVGVYKGGYAMKGSVDIKEFGELMKDGGFDPQIGANEIRQLAEAEVDKARREGYNEGWNTYNEAPYNPHTQESEDK